MHPKRIISGGQTGADQGGLYAARQLLIPTGGYAPKGYRTEAGDNPKLLRDVFGLVEHESRAYPPRTELNVSGSDGTVIFGNVNSPGCSLTRRLCAKYRKPFIPNPTPQQLKEWCERHAIEILNVAGNREESAPGIQESTRHTIHTAFFQQVMEDR